MFLVPLSAQQRIAFYRTLCGPHTKRIGVRMMSRSGRTIGGLSDRFRDGQVTIDSDADVQRAASLSILDPAREFGFDSDTYDGGLLDLTRMVQITYTVDGPMLDEPVTVPVFTGPVVRLRRDGPMVLMEAHSKEAFGMGDVRRTLTIPKGTPKTDAMRLILEKYLGEKNLVGPDMRAKLGYPSSITESRKPWKVAQSIARSMGRQLYFDGAGVARHRDLPDRPSWVFEGDGSTSQAGSLASEVNVEADLTRVKNHVVVKGATPKGKKQAITASATADRTHPLSPWSLGRPGAPMWMVETVSNDHVTTTAEARKVAAQTLTNRLRLHRDVSFDAASVPMFDPDDLIRVATEHENLTMRLDRATLPLGTGSRMSVGSLSTYGLRARRSR